MSRKSRSDDKDAQLRRTAAKLYRSGTPATEVARQLHRSRCWVYKWVHYRADHPWTRFHSASRAPTIIPINSRLRVYGALCICDNS